MHKLVAWLIAVFIFCFLIGAALGQDGPLRNAANQLVRTESNGYLIVAPQTYGGPDGPLQNFANTLVRTDTNGYLIVTNPTGFVTATTCTNQFVRVIATSGAATCATVTLADTSGIAPSTPEYWVATANGTLSAERDLGALTTGLVLNTVTAGVGVPSAYGGTSCTNQFPRSLSASGAATCASVSLTADVTGDLPLAEGGLNASLTASVGGIFYSTASAGAILAGTATAGQIVRSGASAAPTWSTATYPATVTISRLIYASAADVISDLATANNGTLITSGTGVPSISSTLPTAVQDNITRLGTLAAGAVPASLVTAGTFGAGAYVMGTSLSTPSLISTAAITMTPAAGSNLNVVLSTTGDFVVNTSQLYVDTSTGFVGLGMTNLTEKLQLFEGKIALHSSGVVHGMTDLAPTNTHAVISSINDAWGGLLLLGLTDADVEGIHFRAVSGVASPTARVFRISGSKKSGTTGQNLANNEIVASILNNETHVVSFLGSGNVLVGTESPPSAGTWGLILGDGTALSGMGTNTAGLYANDVAGTVEMFAIDEGGASTQLSPHNFTLFAPDASEEYPASYYSRNDYLGVEVAIDTFKLARLVQTLTAQQLIYRRALPTRRDWVDDQDANMHRAMAAYEGWEADACEPTPERDCSAAPPYPIVKRPPAWLEDRLRAKGWLNTTKGQALRTELSAWCAARGLSFAGGTCA